MSFYKEVWQNLSAINVNNYVHKKMGLSYLSWAWAWGVLMERYPESTFTFDPPVTLPDASCEVWVTVTIEDSGKSISRQMWLPVMDHKNKAIKNPDSRQINDTRMRCLTKCLALFGLGHYIYAGEDLPTVAAENPQIPQHLMDQVNSIRACASLGELKQKYTEAAQTVQSEEDKILLAQEKDLKKVELS